MCTAVHYRQLRRHVEPFGGIGIELVPRTIVRAMTDNRISHNIGSLTCCGGGIFTRRPTMFGHPVDMSDVYRSM